MKFYFFFILAVLLLSNLFTIQKSFQEENLDFESCNGFLTIDDVKGVIGDIDVTIDSRGVIPVDGEDSLKTMCASTFESAGMTIGMTVVVLDSSESAIALYEKNLDSLSGQNFEIREYLTFWNNFDVVLNDQGLGSLMGSQYDKFFLNFRTSFDEEKTSLLDVEQLRTLSTIVQKKILDLDDVTISPPNPTPNLDDPDRFKPEHGTPPIETGKLVSPKKQASQGIDPPAVKCNEGLFLVLKFSDNSPACVKQSTVDILYERGWGGMPPPCCKPTDASLDPNDATSSHMDKIIPTLDDFRNTLAESQDFDTILLKFGEPLYDIGSGIHIYVYELDDSTQIWIGYVDKILYVKHVDSNGNILEQLV